MDLRIAAAYWALDQLRGEDIPAMTIAKYHAAEALAVFVGLECEHEDFSDAVRIDYYGEKHCKKVRDELEAKILKESRRLPGGVVERQLPDGD